jgi:general secretion pathway protein H
MSRTGDIASARDVALRQGGFTLIEMVVTLAILAFVAALALPQLSGAQAKTDLRSAARELAAGLRTVRSQAMAHGRSDTFAIDTAQGAFRAGTGATVRRVGKSIRLVLVTATQERIDANSGSIRFFPDGTSTGGGISLSEGKRNALVLVDWLTGRVSFGSDGDVAP